MFDHYDRRGFPASCGDAEAEVVRLRGYIEELRNNRDRDIDNLIAENRDLRALVDESQTGWKRELKENARLSAALAGAEQATTDAISELEDYVDNSDGITGTEVAYDVATMLRKALAADVPAAAPACGSCGGDMWVDDQNWQPADHERAQGRVMGSGRIPCGICNHGGWNVPDGAAARASATAGLRPWPADVPAAADHTCTVCGGAIEWWTDETGQVSRWRHVDQAASYMVGAHHPVPAPHAYLSTACWHGLHHECGRAQAARGDTDPPSCKYCEAQWTCPRHTDPSAPCSGEGRVRIHRPFCALEPDHLGWCGPNMITGCTPVIPDHVSHASDVPASGGES